MQKAKLVLNLLLQNNNTNKYTPEKRTDIGIGERERERIAKIAVENDNH